MAIHFFVKFDVNFENGCILLTIGSIYTKLGDSALYDYTCTGYSGSNS